MRFLLDPTRTVWMLGAEELGNLGPGARQESRASILTGCLIVSVGFYAQVASPSSAVAYSEKGEAASTCESELCQAPAHYSEPLTL